MTKGDGTPPKDTAEKSLGDIVGEVSEKASLLVSQEIELAKAEVADKVSKLGKGAAVGAAAGVFLIFAITMFFHFLALFLNDLFDWNTGWPGYLTVALLLTLLGVIAALLAYRWFKRGSQLKPDMAIEEAKRTRAELEAQTIERDQLGRSLERGEAVKR
ncbi:MAG TPA: phage holin family protein [Thermoleophilaceae bacterium]|nr:phage holin family protein [Thermoleophilaceae bacterium]